MKNKAVTSQFIQNSMENYSSPRNERLKISIELEIDSSKVDHKKTSV